MKRKNKILFRMAMFFLTGIPPALFAQSNGLNGPTPAADTAFYYIDLLHRDRLDINEVRGELLNLKYEDRYSGTTEFTAELFDWQKNLLQSRTFRKKFGQNLYSIPLREFFGGWEPGKIYSLVTHDDTGKKHVCYIRVPEEGEREIPEVEIQVDPLVLDCSSPDESLIQFSGKISGGKGPYRISWRVMDEALVSLYQPRDEKVPVLGHTPVIRVDSPPNYVVSLQVVDACGTEAEERVLITCGEQIKKTNNVFFQQQKELPEPGPN
jgi:hypothetical protein